MNRIPDFTSLISSPPFTFLVGKEHTKLTIQSGLAKHVSRPLDDLMNNGHTRESKHRIAVLEDEEVEVFTAFTQYAYTGNYTVPVQKTASSAESSSAVTTAPAPPPAASPRSGSGSSGGGSDTPNGHVLHDEQQQQQQPPPQNINVVRTQSSASFLPPPAPTPPPFADRIDARPPVRRYAETPLAITQTAGVDDQWENPFAHPAEHPSQRNGTSLRGNTPPVENKREVVVIQDRPQPLPEEVIEPAFPLSRRHSRKDKKKKRKDTVVAANGFDETVPKSLTPPSTPPFDLRDGQDQEGTPKNATKPMVRDYDPDCAIETDTGDDGDIDGDDGDWWDQPAPSQNFSRRRDYEDKLSNARRLQSQNQQQPLSQPSSSPRLSPQQHTMPLIDTSFASHPTPSIPRKKGVKSWNEFASIDYFHQERSEGSGVTTPTPLQALTVPYILFHAKVYVFATRYLISGLAQLCLQKLHTSLVDYPLDPPADNDDDLNSQHALNHQTLDIESLRFNAHAKMFLDILKYTYENTTRFEPESQTSATLLRECELRKLVAQYAACKMRELAVYTPAPIPVPSSPSHGPGSGVSVITAPGGGLRELLDKLPELASDLVFLMM